ncbi:MAG TPA: hypothetical protein PLG78_03085 [Leptospiraceae bacterium]|nr:hypothetical protein [Leptospiraceae bacterium]
MMAAMLLIFQAAAPLFYLKQKSGKAVGGPISMVKSFWLIFAITLWILLPSILSFTAPGELRICFQLLAVSMILRGVVELYLCYGTIRWKTEYGIAHDSLQIGICITLLTTRSLPAVHALIILLTILSLITEMYFVHRFRISTSGPAQGVYFVPETDKRTNRLTLLIFAPQYMAFWTLVFVLEYPLIQARIGL